MALRLAKVIGPEMLHSRRRWLIGGCLIGAGLVLTVLLWPRGHAGDTAAPGRIAPPNNLLGNPTDSRPGFPQPPAGQIPAWQVKPPSPPAVVPTKVRDPRDPVSYRPPTSAPADPTNRPRRPVPGLSSNPER